jgi:hypothetical protein
VVVCCRLPALQVARPLPSSSSQLGCLHQHHPQALLQAQPQHRSWLAAPSGSSSCSGSDSIHGSGSSGSLHQRHHQLQQQQHNQQQQQLQHRQRGQRVATAASAASPAPFQGPDGYAGGNGQSSFLSAFWRFLRPHTIRGTILGTSAVVTKVCVGSVSCVTT